jgi:hypothetical protein
MVAAAFLVYSFGYIMGTARKVSIKGIDVDSAGHVSNPQNTSRLGRSFSPKQVKQIVLDNKEVLVEHFPSEFTDDSVVKSLDILIERASDNDEALALVEYDDHHQDKEMVYAVAKDDISKRITLVFRGTDNELAGMNNWKTNLSFFKEGVAAPDAVKDAVDGDEIWLHGGFYSKFGVHTDSSVSAGLVLPVLGLTPPFPVSFCDFQFACRLHFWYNGN